MTIAIGVICMLVAIALMCTKSKKDFDWWLSFFMCVLAVVISTICVIGGYV